MCTILSRFCRECARRPKLDISCSTERDSSASLCEHDCESTTGLLFDVDKHDGPRLTRTSWQDRTLRRTHYVFAYKVVQGNTLTHARLGANTQRPSSSGSGAGAGKWQHDLFEDDPMGIGSYAPRVARVFGDRPASAPSSSGTARGRGMAAYSASTSQAAAPPPPPAAQGESSNLFARVGFQGVESRVTAAQERRQAEDARREQERQERLAREETARKRREEQRRADEEKRKRLESERKRKEVEDRWVEELALWKVENSSNAVPVEVHGLMNGTSEEDVKVRS